MRDRTGVQAQYASEPPFEELPFDEGAPVDELGSRGRRCRAEKRERVVRIVEYSRYPRIDRSERRLVGFTRNQSRSGLCIVASEPEVEGTLLRIGLRTVDGGAALDALAHVAWCERRTDGRFWIGLSLLERAGRRMRKVRRSGFGDGEEPAADGDHGRAASARPRLVGSA